MESIGLNSDCLKMYVPLFQAGQTRPLSLPVCVYTRACVHDRVAGVQRELHLSQGPPTSLPPVQGGASPPHAGAHPHSPRGGFLSSLLVTWSRLLGGFSLWRVFVPCVQYSRAGLGSQCGRVRLPRGKNARREVVSTYDYFIIAL